MTQSINILTSF